jgi:hypothetical protein
VKLTATFDDLRSGDVLLEADGCVVSQTGVHVVERAAEGRDRLELVKPRLVSTECNLYRDFACEYLIEREPAGAAKADPTDRDMLVRLVKYGPRLISNHPTGNLSDRYRPVPPGRREHGARPEVGDVVLVDSVHYWRPAVVTRVGRVNLRVAYMTPHGIKELEQGAIWVAVLSCQRKIADVYVVTGESWAQRAIAGA